MENSEQGELGVVDTIQVDEPVQQEQPTNADSGPELTAENQEQPGADDPGQPEPDPVQEAVPLTPGQILTMTKTFGATHVPTNGPRMPTQVAAGKMVRIKQVQGNIVQFEVAGLSVLHEATVDAFRSGI
jgi:hypothetical protein